MSATTFFRLLLATSIVLALLGIISEFATVFMLPEPVQDVIAEDMESPITKWDLILLAISLPALAILLAGYIGLFLLKSWGRACFIFASIVIYLITPLLGSFLMSSITYMLYDLASVTYGVIIAMSFLPPIRQILEKRPPSQPS